MNAGVKDLICGLLEKDPAQRYSPLDCNVVAYLLPNVFRYTEIFM